jgi:hypothetical protein
MDLPLPPRSEEGLIHDIVIKNRKWKIGKRELRKENVTFKREEYD